MESEKWAGNDSDTTTTNSNKKLRIITREYTLVEMNVDIRGQV